MTHVVRKRGDKFGASDSDLPCHYSDYILSRLLDSFDSPPTPEYKALAWLCIPRPLRMDFNYCRWEYVPPDPQHPDHAMSLKLVLPPTPCTMVPPTPHVIHSPPTPAYA